jgi:2-polyprenyl-3-methyl-5-hydroxy-6-metoxy-1,4-benzoquinol methylase
MKNMWDEIFKSERFCTDLNPRGFVKKNIAKISKPGPILDVGCGCGRHLVYLTAIGYTVFGIDTSDIALEKAKEHLKAFGLKATLQKSTMWDIPFDDTVFSAALVINVLNHAMPDEITNTVSAISERLVHDGLLLVTLLTNNDYRRCGRQVDKNTFICDKGPEKGVLHTFFDESLAKALFKENFIIDNFETVSGTVKVEDEQEVKQEFFQILALKNKGMKK